MTKVDLYGSQGTKRGKVDLPKGFSGKVNLPVLAQMVAIYEDRQHPGLSKVKTRGEVKASTRKIYRQKGTGRARHGAISAPIFVGGGVVHGPDGRKRRKKTSKKVAAKALETAAALKTKQNAVVALDGIAALKKTKTAQALINKLLKNTGQKKLLLATGPETGLPLAFRNLKNVSVKPFKSLNARDVYFSGLLVIDRGALKKEIKKKTSKKTSKKKSYF